MRFSSRQIWSIRITMAVVFATALAYVPYRFMDGEDTARIERMRGELIEIRSQVGRFTQENRKLRREIFALKNDIETIEDIARTELGFVRKGEIVIRLEEGR